MITDCVCVCSRWRRSQHLHNTCCSCPLLLMKHETFGNCCVLMSSPASRWVYDKYIDYKETLMLIMFMFFVLSFSSPSPRKVQSTFILLRMEWISLSHRKKITSRFRFFNGRIMGERFLLFFSETINFFFLFQVPYWVANAFKNIYIHWDKHQNKAET